MIGNAYPATSDQAPTLQFDRPSTDADPDQPSAQRRRWWHGHPGLLAAGSYLLGAFFVTARLFAHLGHRVPDLPGDASGDRIQSEYFLAFAARLVTHGGNPFFTDRLNAPIGVNTMANTSVLGFGIPMAPVTLLFGPSVTFDILIVAGITGTGAAWFWVLRRHLGLTPLAAWLGGLLGAFAPSMISHAIFHPNLTAQFLVPFIIWRAIRLREPGRWLRNGLVLASLVVYQAFINEETLLLAALGTGLFMVLYALQRRDEARAGWRPLLAGLGVTATASLVVLAYPLWWQFLGKGSYHGGVPGMTKLHIDLLGLTSFPSNSVAERLAATTPPLLGTEEHAYFGWPLVILAVTIVVWLWRELIVRCAAITGAVFAVLALGSPLTLRGHPIGLYGPFAVLKRLPLLDTLLPTRLGEVTTWAMAPILAIAVHRLGQLSYPTDARAARLRRVLTVGVLAAALVPIAPLPIPVRVRPAVPAFVASGAWRSYVGPDQSVLVVPLPTYDKPAAMMWATSTGLDMKLSHGYFLAPKNGTPGQHATVGPVTRPTDGFLTAATYAPSMIPPVTPAARKQAQVDLAYWHAAIIIVPDDVPATDAIRRTLDSLIGPGRLVGGVWLWDVRHFQP